MSSSWRRAWSPLSRTLVAIGLAVLGAVLVWAALIGPPTPDATLAQPPPTAEGTPSAGSNEPTPTAGPSTASPSAKRSGAKEMDVRDRVEGLVLPESDPVAVSVPRIGARSRLIDLGLDADGAMEVPQNPALAGWFVRGAAPGALGPAVIAGHVTWDGAPAVFHRLGAVRRGDQVNVTREDGRTAVFTVTRVARFSKSRFPTQAVYGAIDHAGLRLITCGGTYDAARRRYLDNVIVFAQLTKVREPRG